MRSVYVKTLYDKRWFTCGWFVGFGLLAALMTSFYPAMHQDGALDQLVAQMPAGFQGLVGDLTNLSQFDTYMAAQLFDIRMPLIAGIMAIILALGLSTREEEDGELRSLLALPLSRAKLYVQKWLALMTIMCTAAAGSALGILLLMPFIDDASISPVHLLSLVAMMALVMICYGTIVYAVGMLSGRRGAAMAVSVVVIIGSFLLSTFGQAVDWLEKYEGLSLLHYFPAVSIVKDDFSLMNVLVLVSITLVMLLIGWTVFRRRDVQ